MALDEDLEMEQMFEEDRRLDLACEAISLAYAVKDALDEHEDCRLVLAGLEACCAKLRLEVTSFGDCDAPFEESIREAVKNTRIAARGAFYWTARIATKKAREQFGSEVNSEHNENV